jgi:hypothetical protein
MGGLFSSEDAILALYRKYSVGKDGCPDRIGGGNVDASHFRIGGVPDLKDYEHTVMSAAKQQLIRDIASDMADKIHIPGLSPAGKNLDEIIRQLKDTVPDPRGKNKGNKKTWSSKSEHQLDVCNKMAGIINNRMGADVIKKKQGSNRYDASEVCEQVAEVMNSLMHGLDAEFAGVRQSVHNSLRNLELLNEMLKKQHKAIDDRLSRGADSTIATETATLRSAHREIADEFSRQLEMLESMLGEVIKPAELELAKALKDGKEFHVLVKKIKQHPGTGKFSEKLSFA